MVSRLETVKSTPETSTPKIAFEVSKPAAEQVKALIKAQKPGMAVRVFVQMGGGGCGGGGGPSFGMAFDKPKNGDEVIMHDGVKFVIDPYSAEFLNGAQVDFVQDVNESGFKITNPNLPQTEGGGGCGSGGCGSGGCGSGGGCGSH